MALNNNVTATDPTVDPATGKPKITTTPAVASPTVAQPVAPVPAGNTTGATTTATAPMAQPITPSVQPVPALPSPASIPALPGPVSAPPSNMGTQTPTITDPYGTGGQKNAQGQYTPAQPNTNPVPTIASAQPAPLPAGYTKDPTTGVVGFQNAGGAGAGPVTQPIAQKYWDNATQSYLDSTIKPTQTQAQSDALTAGQTGPSYQGSIADQNAAWQAKYAGTQSVPTYDANGNLTGTQSYAGGTASGPGLADIAAQNVVNSTPSPGSLQATAGAPLASTTGAATGGGTPSNTGVSGQSTPVNTGNATLDALLSGASNGGGVNQTPTTPGNSLLDQTLSVGNLADPVQQALAAWKTFQGATDPQFQADQRDAIRSAAAGGALGSGQLNTSLGDIANQRQNTLQTAQQSLLENALNTQNSNAYANEGIAAQQQGFQSNQQQNAVNNSLAELLAGSSGNPADTELALSGIYGNNAGQASSALSSLISGTQNKNAASGANNTLSDLLNQLLGNAGASQVPSGNSDLLNLLLKGGTPSVSTGVSG